MNRRSRKKKEMQSIPKNPKEHTETLEVHITQKADRPERSTVTLKIENTEALHKDLCCLPEQAS